MPEAEVRARPPRAIRPAQPRAPERPTLEPPGVCFYDLPAELRIEVYKLVLENVIIHVLPPGVVEERHAPHALVCTSRQVRHEVLPIIHSVCKIRAAVTDFNFEGLLAFINRIPPDDQRHLLKNQNLKVELCTTLTPPGMNLSLRKWLHDRADDCRPQPNWEYHGPRPSPKVANDLKRRAKRMPEPGKQAEFVKMVRAIGVCVDV